MKLPTDKAFEAWFDDNRGIVMPQRALTPEELLDLIKGYARVAFGRGYHAGLRAAKK